MFLCHVFCLSESTDCGLQVYDRDNNTLLIFLLLEFADVWPSCICTAMPTTSVSAVAEDIQRILVFSNKSWFYFGNALAVVTALGTAIVTKSTNNKDHCRCGCSFCGRGTGVSVNLGLGMSGCSLAFHFQSSLSVLSVSVCRTWYQLSTMICSCLKVKLLFAFF